METQISRNETDDSEISYVNLRDGWKEQTKLIKF